MDADARIAAAIERLQTQEDPEALKSFIRKGIQFAPLDARLYSLLGIAEERSGNQAAAEQLYNRALALLPTEIFALTRMSVLDVSQQRTADAAEKLEIIARRWPMRWQSVEHLLPSILSDPQSRAVIVSRFASEKRLRDTLINSLVRQKALLPVAYDVVLEWYNRAVPDLATTINRLTAAFISETRYADAYLLFLLTRGEGADAGADYVYNGGFQLPFSGNPFDWRVRQQPGVSFEMNTGTEIAAPGIAAGSESSLAIRFLDTPIQFNNVEQLIRLVPGAYDFSVSYSVRDLKAPKPLQIALRCTGNNQILATIPFQQGSIALRSETVRVQVPVQDCALQRISVFNAPIPMSWRNRYSGTLRLNEVGVSRAEG